MVTVQILVREYSITGMNKYYIVWYTLQCYTSGSSTNSIFT